MTELHETINATTAAETSTVNVPQYTPAYLETLRTSITLETTLGDLIDLMGEIKKLPKVPKRKQLREMAGEPVAEYQGCAAFANGYCTYENGSGRTTMFLPDCRSFTYYFTRLRESEKIKGIRETDELPEGLLDSEPWVTAVTLIGEHRIENLTLNRKGDRRGTRVTGDDYRDEDELRQRDPMRTAFVWKDEQFGENPETAYIRKETLMRALKSMTEKQREVFLLYYRDGYTQREIAKMLGLGKTTVLTHLGLAVKKVQDTFR